MSSGGQCGKTSSAITDVLLKSTVPVNWSSTGGSIWKHMFEEKRGGSAEERRLTPPYRAVTGCSEVKGPG